ncbi:MAG: thiamine-binding protein [Marmoricola sp.]
MIVALSISPSGPPLTATEPGATSAWTAEAGVSEAVAEAVKVIRASGLPCETNAMFTNIEGDWDEVMAVVKQAVEVVSARYPRVGLVLKADLRPGYDGQLAAKVQRVEEHLREG